MQLVIPKFVKQFVVQKKYYKKYFYKVVLKVDESLIKPSARRNSYSYYRSSNLRPAQQALLKEICELPVKDADCKFRTENKWVSIFTNDEEFISALFEDLSHRIQEFHGPKNDNHKEILKDNIRIRVRQRLFDNAFRYKVYLNSNWRFAENAYEEVKLWLEQLENKDNKRWAVNSTLKRYFGYHQGYKGYTAAIYLNDAEDMMMCQMRFHSEISYIEEAVLVSSL